MTRLFVANIRFDSIDDDLAELFGRFGPIKDTVVAMDKGTGNSRGFGFVEFQSPLDAEAALKALDQTVWNGRTITVREAQKRSNNA